MSGFTSTRWLMLVVLGSAICCSRLAGAVEVQLRQQAKVTTSIVVLADVADIYTSDSQLQHRLGSAELFPAPAGTAIRYLGLRELQDLLIRSRINLSEIAFSGASQVAISTVEPAPVAKPVVATELPEFKKRRALELATNALRTHLTAAMGKALPLEISLELTEPQLRLLGTIGTEITASGGEAPFTGQGRYILLVKNSDGESEIQVDASVSLPPSVLVATRAILKGTALRETDVELRPLAGPVRGEDVFYSLDEVLNYETVQSIAAGQPIVARMLRKPLLVHRGDPVTVFSRSAGVVVKTTARARDDGSHGDLISVESLVDRSTYYARVCGVQQVEVFARATVAEVPVPAAASPSNRSSRSFR